jgi:hypothetical protein
VVFLDATVGGVTASLPITIHPRITALGLPETVQSGTAFTGTVTLAGPSAVDTIVYLQSSWGILDVQSSVTIPAGSISAPFDATSSVVTEPSQVFVVASLGRTDFQSEGLILTP